MILIKVRDDEERYVGDADCPQMFSWRPASAFRATATIDEHSLLAVTCNKRTLPVSNIEDIDGHHDELLSLSTIWINIPYLEATLVPPAATGSDDSWYFYKEKRGPKPSFPR